MNVGSECEMLLTMKNKENQMHMPSMKDHPELAEGTEAKSHQACGFIHQFAMEARGGTH